MMQVVSIYSGQLEISVLQRASLSGPQPVLELQIFENQTRVKRCHFGIQLCNWCHFLSLY